MNRLLALDWGSSALRGAMLDDGGNVLEERSFPRGILTVAAGEFPAVFRTCFGDWMAHADLCLIAGMAGSQQGWVEAPYCACPAGFHDIASQLMWVDWNGPGRVGIVPGLSIEHAGVPDVMRGEETQILGALELLSLADARLVLPGTHSKWASVEGGRVVDFSTFMTGEFYALLRRHSILARTLPEAEPPMEHAAFGQGVRHALGGPGLLNTAFSTRTLALFKRLESVALPSYLSGLVIGEELKSQALQPRQTVLVLGADALAARYAQALDIVGATVQQVSAGVTWRGIRAIANTLR
ncbi:MAG: 2-dehydro-3-deoxygalactonokinase [Polaromonas sp.]|jgi:2-dehydro-3-deoxygalactonokinase|nr:2-dehydro-3-deoxygalactonokinase [Polaromonas sp.]